MGRGRAKAKQTKVARELKYLTPDTDLRALERELHRSATDGTPSRGEPEVEREADDYDEYGKWASGQP